MNDTVTLHFKTANGEIVDVVGTIGQSLMEAAVMADVPGIEAECGGCCNCATCHVFALDAFEEPNEQEDALLDDTATPRTATSRLSCQIDLSAELDGASFAIPDEQ